MEKKKSILTMDIRDLRKGAKTGKKTAYPTKTTLNLGVKPKTINSPSRALPLFALVLALIALFSKFGVSDRLAAVNRAEDAAMQAETQLQQLREANKDYEAVRAEYDRRVFPELGMSAAADAMDILGLIEGKLLGNARIHTFSTQSPLINVQLSGVTLAETAQLVKSLEESPLVSYVMVYTAGTGNEAAATPAPTPTPTPTPTPKPKKTPKGQTPAPTETPAQEAPTPTPEARVSVTMTITLAAGGEQ